jgi:hypothetical protein
MRVIAPAPRELWRKVLDENVHALPEHAPEWIDAMVEHGSYENASRFYEFSDGRRFVLPLVRRRGPSAGVGWYGSFPPAWGIGGLTGSGVDAEVVASVIDDLRSLEAVRVALRPDPLQAATWAAVDGPGITRIPRRGHVIDLSGGVEAARSRLTKTTGRSIRTAEKRGVRIERDRDGSLLPLYYELYLSSIKRWAEHQHEPLALARWRGLRRDPIDKMYRLAERMGDGFRLYLAFAEDRPAAGMISLFGRTAHQTRGAMDRDLAARSRANDLLMWTTIKAACEAGCSVYHLGETGQSTSLAQYKERFGARAVDYAEIRLERLPVTRVDKAVRSGVKRLLGFRDAS